jgi:type III secretory pathway component EscR
MAGSSQVHGEPDDQLDF